MVISPLQSVYDALLLSLRRRSANGNSRFRAQLHAFQSQERTGTGRGRDRPGAEYDQDATDPFAPVEYGPAASDARHLVSLSAIVPLRAGQYQVAPVFYYRSALPVFIIEGLD